jgi:hypothetical protein
MICTTSRRYLDDDVPPLPPIGRPRRGAGQRAWRAPLSVRVDGAIHTLPQLTMSESRRSRTSPRRYADDVRFVFPGRSSWAADLRGKDEVERWVRRFVRVGLQLEPHKILVAGPPWDTTVCLRFTDEATASDGTIVYSNQGTIFAKIAWGKVTYYEVNEDTQKVAEFDEWLAAQEPPGA